MHLSRDIQRGIISNLADFIGQLRTVIRLYQDLDLHRNERLKETDAFISQLVQQELTGDNLVELISTHLNIFQENNMYSREFGHLMLSSFFTTSFSLFEMYLKKTVEIADAINPSSPLVKSVTGSIIDQFTKHLYSVHGISEAGKDNQKLERIKVYRVVRNAIVHSLGELRKDESRLHAVKTLALLYDNHNKTVKIEKLEFLQDFHDLIIKYGARLNRGLMSRYDK